MLCELPLQPPSQPNGITNQILWTQNNISTTNCKSFLRHFHRSGTSHHPVVPALKTINSGAQSVPEASFKTTESPEHKSITPEKDYDVTMTEADVEGGAGGIHSESAFKMEDEEMSEARGNDGGGEGSGEEGRNGNGESNNNGSVGGGNGGRKSSSEDRTNGKSPDKEGGNNGTNGGNNNAKSGGNEDKVGGGVGSADAPNLPLLIGTLSYSDSGGTRRHMIRGNWRYENTLESRPQRFELTRTLAAEEDLKELPKDGVFSGSFSMEFIVTNSKGKIKTKTRVIMETGVKITFMLTEGEPKTYTVRGQGNNEYGAFELHGTATKVVNEDDPEDPAYNIQLRKSYATEPLEETPQKKSKDKKRKYSGLGSVEVINSEELPPPCKSHDYGVISLRGKLVRHTSPNLGFTDVTHKITGVWANSLEFILKDPENKNGLCNAFQYEHKTSNGSDSFPLSGKYTGWFHLKDEIGNNPEIPEKDITLKFKKNNAGYHNVEGKGSNVFGKYTITGTLTEDGTITLFRHFQENHKQKKSTSLKISTPAPGPLNGNGDFKSPKPIDAGPLPLKFDDVVIPHHSELVAAIIPPEQYSAVCRGTIKINENGAHVCNGSWALTLEHFTSGSTSKFHFGIEAHRAAEDAQLMLDKMKASGADASDNRKIEGNVVDGLTPVSLANTTFPIDSAFYKGAFKLKRGSKHANYTEKQIILKFVKNSSGSYNVYGKGVNDMGTYDAIGTLLIRGKTSGQLQLWKTYAPAAIVEPEPVSKPVARPSGKVFPGSLTEKVTEDSGPVPEMKPPENFPPSISTLQRRESSRQTKVPSRLEDGDPQAQIDRLMEKCSEILRELQNKDSYKFFLEPVDPVALNLPTYFDIIDEPMDLGTIQKKMNAKEVHSPEEFSGLVRLVFENAIKFNTIPDSVVHLSARNLLGYFNQKYKAIQNALDAAKKNKKMTKAERLEMKRKEKEAAKKKLKEEKDLKRKSTGESGNEPKRARVEDLVASNRSVLDKITAAAQDPNATSQVSRTEFNLLLEMVQNMQEHIVAVHNLLSNASKSSAVQPIESSLVLSSFSASETSNTTTKKKKKPPQKGSTTEHVESEEPVEPKQEPEHSPPPSPQVSPEPEPVVDIAPLTLAEQEDLSEAINQLPENLLPGAMQIIREADFVSEDDEEVDVDIDQLDTRTLRRLQQFVRENVKPKRKRQSKKQKQTIAAAHPSPLTAPAPSPEASPEPEPEPEEPSKVSQPRESGKSFFPFGADDSDSDSDADADTDEPKKESNEQSKSAPAADPFADVDDDDDADDDDEDLQVNDIASNWVATTTKRADNEADDSSNDDDDDLWGAAKKEAEASKAREADRAKREEKMRAEAEAAAQQRMAEAAALGEQVRAKREAEEAAEARLREEQEKEAEEARKAAREKALQEVNDVKNTIDLDAQRDLMMKYEQEFNDNYSAGASPSSDFGF